MLRCDGCAAQYDLQWEDTGLGHHASLMCMSKAQLESVLTRTGLKFLLMQTPCIAKYMA